MYEDGNTIVYWTARGSSSGLYWFQLTLKQLNEWGCKFHELRMGKPSYDLFIDDKNIDSDKFFSRHKLKYDQCNQLKHLQKLI